MSNPFYNPPTHTISLMVNKINNKYITTISVYTHLTFKLITNIAPHNFPNHPINEIEPDKYIEKLMKCLSEDYYYNEYWFGYRPYWFRTNDEDILKAYEAYMETKRGNLWQAPWKNSFRVWNLKEWYELIQYKLFTMDNTFKYNYYIDIWRFNPSI